MVSLGPNELKIKFNTELATHNYPKQLHIAYQNLTNNLKKEKKTQEELHKRTHSFALKTVKLFKFFIHFHKANK